MTSLQGNKRPLGLRAPLSNNTWSMIQSPMKLNEHPMTLIWPFNATQGQMSWGKLKDHIYDLLYRRFIQNLISCSIYNLLKLRKPWFDLERLSKVKCLGKLIVHRGLPICVSNKLFPDHAKFMKYIPLKTQWPWFALSISSKVKCYKVN